jgi:hypothetical protein
MLEDLIDINEKKSHIKGVIMSLLHTRRNVKPHSRQILQQYGDKPIKKMYICRKPVAKYIKNMIKVFNFLEKHYTEKEHDTFFHLFMICDIGDKMILVEKNQDVNIDIFKNNTEDQDYITIPLNDQKTIMDLLDNAYKRVGDYRLFHYDGLSLNCQTFLIDLLESSNLMSSQDIHKFIKQDVSKIVGIWSRIVMQNITSLKNRLDMAIQGYGDE